MLLAMPTTRANMNLDPGARSVFDDVWLRVTAPQAMPIVRAASMLPTSSPTAMTCAMLTPKR